MALDVYQRLKIWDRPVRLFHWINLLCFLGLLGVGLVIFYGGDLGISNDGKIALKQIHVLIGYVFAANLLVRIIWGFVGSPHARWRHLFAFGPRYRERLARYLRKDGDTDPLHNAGHNPLGQLSVFVLYLLLLSQAVTGLFLAGSDLFWPPVGHLIAEWIAAPGVAPADLVPYAKPLYDPEHYAEMRSLRAPFISLHVYGFYALIGMAVLHSAAVVRAEIRQGGSLVSAMITGYKMLPQKNKKNQ
ncbi:putative Ni/Fe-hydrogenase B-type cytochrome subunit [alpha proteobacterium Q-1]|nr:putative Ni/Fe-hydrogenase B-type cytochrome subunit [alpha proteobacterium Q-1]